MNERERDREAHFIITLAPATGETTVTPQYITKSNTTKVGK